VPGRQVSFEIGLSRERPLVIAGADGAIDVRCSGFGLGDGLGSRRGGAVGLPGAVFTAVPEIA
jgi:hypothetical protein